VCGTREDGPVLEMSRERFEELVGEALDLVPAELLRELDNVVIQVEDQHPEEPGLLGLYHGIDLTRRTHEYSFTLPDTITIYRLPILAACDSEDDVAEEVAVTVVHELGHHFGLDDERLHELGWG
jgi:predicted Zn-dependent protease with MMP-like domain